MRSDVRTSHAKWRSFGGVCRWLVAAVLFLYGVATFDRGAPTWSVASMVLFTAVLTLQFVHSQAVRAYSLWAAGFLVVQALLTPWLQGDFITLPPRMNSTVELRSLHLPGMPDGLRHVTTDERGFRVNPRIDYAKKRGLRIFAIGGSTTEDIVLDDRATWTHLLQEELSERGRPAEVINTGVSGLRAEHHLATLKVVARLQPDLVIFLLGANDWNRQVAAHFERWVWKPASLRYSALGRLVDAAVISPLRRQVTGRTWADSKRVIDASNEFAYGQRSIDRPVTHALRPTAVAAEYAATLRAISRLCRESDLTCLFMTQPHAYYETAPAELRSRFWMTPPWAAYTLDLESMNRIASLYNDFLRSFAKQEGHPLCDLAAEVQPLPAYFYDDLHFTDEGARHVAELVVPCVLAAQPTGLVRHTVEGRRR